MASREIPKDWKMAHSHLQERQERGSGELQASQPHLDPWEDSGKTHPGTT